MIITKKALSRRTVLRGIGVSLALPLLDAMVPALTASARGEAGAPLRVLLHAERRGDEPHRRELLEADDGRADFEFSPILSRSSRSAIS
jgi:hypothetical protein